ncbi:MAG: hypothetical protein ACP5KH_05230 [Thermodesulfovibrio sp.]
MSEILILIFSGLAFSVGILKNQFVLATGAFVNGLIYSSAIWQLYGFFKLSRSEKNENWINFTTLEKTAS